MVLSGHDHDLMLLYDGRTVLAEAKEEGQQMIAVDLAVTVRGEAEGRRQVSWWPRFRVIDTADVTPDPGVLARVEAYGQTLSKELDVVLGTTSTPLDSRKTLVRSEETAIGNLVTAAVTSGGQISSVGATHASIIDPQTVHVLHRRACVPIDH